MDAPLRMWSAPLLLLAACSSQISVGASMDLATTDDAAAVALDLSDPPAPRPDLTAPPPDLTSPKPDLSVASLDLRQVSLFDNPSDVADWPITTRITKVDIRPSGVHLEFDKQDGPNRWPDIVPPGWDGPLQYTVGLVMNVNGTWCGSAAIQYWYGLFESGGNIAEVGQIPKNWYYDGRWGCLQGYQPRQGEQIGVFVVAGNARGVRDGSQSPKRERSNIVLLNLPGPAGATFTY